MTKNSYTEYYKNENLKRKINFLEPAENFVRIFKIFNKKKKLKCLDFGVGDGRHTEYLLKNGHTVIGTDISQAAINLTKKRLPKFDNLILLKDKNYLNIKFQKNLDLIVCWETIHWLGNLLDIEKLLNNFFSMLTKNGKLIITFPSEDHYLLKNKIDKFTYKIKYIERKDMIICAPPIQYLKKKLKNLGFKIDAIFKYTHGRTLFAKNKKNSLKNIDFKKNLFAMYGFHLSKKN